MGGCWCCCIHSNSPEIFGYTLYVLLPPTLQETRRAHCRYRFLGNRVTAEQHPGSFSLATAAAAASSHSAIHPSTHSFIPKIPPTTTTYVGLHQTTVTSPGIGRCWLAGWMAVKKHNILQSMLDISPPSSLRIGSLFLCHPPGSQSLHLLTDDYVFNKYREEREPPFLLSTFWVCSASSSRLPLTCRHPPPTATHPYLIR